MLRRNLLLKLALTASAAPFPILSPVQAQPGAGSPPLGQPGQIEDRGSEVARGGNTGGAGQPGQPGQTSTPGTGSSPAGTGSVNNDSAAPGAAIPKQTAPPL